MSEITSAINVNVPADVKNDANVIFSNLGLNMSTAINMFLKKVISERGIPFEVKESKPSRELLEALKELNYMENHPDEYKAYDDVDKMFKEILDDK